MRFGRALSFCKVNRLQILPVRVRKSRVYVLERFVRVASASFRCELDAQTASVLHPQMPKTRDFTVKFAQISLPPCLLCAASGLLINLYVARARFTQKRGKIYKILREFLLGFFSFARQISRQSGTKPKIMASKPNLNDANQPREFS